VAQGHAVRRRRCAPHRDAGPHGDPGRSQPFDEALQHCGVAAAHVAEAVAAAGSPRLQQATQGRVDEPRRCGAGGVAELAAQQVPPKLFERLLAAAGAQPGGGGDVVERGGGRHAATAQRQQAEPELGEQRQARQLQQVERRVERTHGAAEEHALAGAAPPHLAGEAEFGQQREQLPVLRRDDVVEAVPGEVAEVGGDRQSADDRRAIEDGDAGAALAQEPGRRQAGDAAADHGDARTHRRVGGQATLRPQR
jgi:hypothetical protein